MTSTINLLYLKVIIICTYFSWQMWKFQFVITPSLVLPLIPPSTSFSSIFYILLVFIWKVPISYYVTDWWWWDCQNVTALSTIQPCKLPNIDPAVCASWSLQSCFDFFSFGEKRKLWLASIENYSSIQFSPFPCAPLKEAKNEALIKIWHLSHLIYIEYIQPVDSLPWNIEKKPLQTKTKRHPQIWSAFLFRLDLHKGFINTY